MIRAMIFQADGVLRVDQGVIDVALALHDPQTLVWMDFEANPADEDEAMLRKTFNFHPLAIDDALQETHVPRVDDWRDYLYIVLHAVALETEDDPRPGQSETASTQSVVSKEKEQAGVDVLKLDTLEVDIFLGKNYMVTHHDYPVPAVKKLWDVLQRNDRPFRYGVDHLFYRLTDEIVASYMPVIARLDNEIDDVEDEIFNRPTAETLERIFAVKRSVLHLRRILGPQRDAINKLARDEYPVIDEHERVYFRDIYDHLVRLYDISENIRDLVAGSLDIYLSVTNNRMNDIMKTLTLITTLFMPISFLAGFFGMNFFQPSIPLDIWTGAPAFMVTLLIFILTPVVMFAWMRRRKWM